MTPSQVSLYRVFVAARHSAHLAASPGLRAQWLEAMDALGSFLDLVPTQGAERGGGGLAGACPRCGGRPCGIPSVIPAKDDTAGLSLAAKACLLSVPPTRSFASRHAPTHRVGGDCFVPRAGRYAGAP
jgi:hypothetical protein